MAPKTFVHCSTEVQRQRPLRRSQASWQPATPWQHSEFFLHSVHRPEAELQPVKAIPEQSLSAMHATQAPAPEQYL